MQANRDGFTEFRVEFEITSGLVASEDEALKGNFTQGEQATASWTRRGDDETYRIVFRPLDLEKPADEMPLRPARKGGGDIEIPLGSSAKDICYLARGEYFAFHTPGSKACMIHKKADAPWHVDRIEFNPFGFDLGSSEAIGPYKLLMASVSGKVTAEVENTTKDGEHDLVTIFGPWREPKGGPIWTPGKQRMELLAARIFL